MFSFLRNDDKPSQQDFRSRFEKIQQERDDEFNRRRLNNEALREENTQLREKVARLEIQIKHLKDNSFRAFLTSVLALLLSSSGVGFTVNYLTGDEKEILILIVGGMLIIFGVLTEILAFAIRS